nr:unnamed protein product [Callosobruchus analis]
MEDKKGAGHSLYMDNFYNSVGLSEQLLQEKVYTTETLRANGAGNPKEEKLAACIRTKDCVSKWKDKREVLAVSTEFGDEQVTTISKRGIEKGKP